jgi:hypothetical protein
VAQTGLKRKSKLTSEELTQWCVDSEKDPNDQKARQMAARKLRKLKEEKLFEDGKAGLRRPDCEPTMESSKLITLPSTVTESRIGMMTFPKPYHSASLTKDHNSPS